MHMSRERTPGGSAFNLLCLCLRELSSTFSRLTQRVELSDAELEGNIRQLSFRIQRLENIQRRSKAFRSELRAARGLESSQELPLRSETNFSARDAKVKFRDCTSDLWRFLDSQRAEIPEVPVWES